MEPITLIMTALVAGAAAAAKDTGGEAVRDAYTVLRSLLARRFGGTRRTEGLVEDYEEDPETWEKPLAKALRQSGAATDEELLAAAQEVLARSDPAGAASAKYAVTIAGSSVEGFNMGDHATIDMTFLRGDR